MTNQRTRLPDGEWEAMLIAGAEAHAAMRRQTRDEAAALIAELRASGRLIPVAAWERKAKAEGAGA